MLEKETVEHIARLARIGITNEECVEYQEKLSRILGFVDELTVVENVTVEAAPALLRYAVPREDRERNALPETKDQIIANMPHTKNGSLEVRSVLAV